MKAVVSQQSAAGSQQAIGDKPISALPNFRERLTIKNKARFIWFRCVLLFISAFSFAGIADAQPDSNSAYKAPPVDMAGVMRSNGKIYVVVTVLVIILIGVFFYLTRLDRKITRLEKGTWKE